MFPKHTANSLLCNAKGLYLLLYSLAVRTILCSPSKQHAVFSIYQAYVLYLCCIWRL